MRTQQILLLGLLVLAPAGADSAGGQSSPVPLGPAVEIDRTCTYSPTVLEVDGQVVAVWKRAYNPHGFWARRGPSLAELGPETLLYDQIAFGDLQAAVQPGGFVLAWAGEGGPSTTEVVFQRFRSDLTPAGPVVVVGSGVPSPAPSLLVDAAGEVTVAFFGSSGMVQARRYSAADVPLTPLIDVGPEVYDGVLAVTRLAAGDDGFLVAWESVWPAPSPGLWVRAFGWGGAPAGPSVRVTNLEPNDIDVEWADGAYLAAYATGPVMGRRLAPDGTLLGSEELLGPSASAFEIELAAAGDSLWLLYGDLEAGIRGVRIGWPAGTAGSPLLLVPRPTSGGANFVAPSAATPVGDGLLYSWVLGSDSPLLSPPCLNGQAVYSQALSLGGVVDVPAASPAGLLAAALLAAAGALWILQAQRRG